MKTLIAEDDFTSRTLLLGCLARFGECHVAAHGKEALQACRLALRAGQPYDLICLDILMPEMDGLAALRKIRSEEEALGVISSRGAKIIMTTGVDNVKNVMTAFHHLCDGYLVKPIDQLDLTRLLRQFQLIEVPASRKPGPAL